MAPHVSSMHAGEWCAYERPYQKAESSPLNDDDDIQMGNSPDQDDCSESLASSSSCLFSSTDMTKESTSTRSSSISDISLCNIPEHTSWNANHQEFPGVLQGTPLMPRYQYGNVEDCVDPQLMASDSMFAHNWRAVDNGGWTVMGQVPSREATLGKGCRDSQMPARQNMRQQNRNDFDIAFDEMTVKVPSSKPGARMWLHTWVAMNPDRFPDTVELESLKILSGLSDSEIMEWLNRHVSIQLDSETEPIFRRQVETPRPISVPRYRPKCRRSRRRFRYIAEVPDETRIYECTHRCGQSFHKKGQWTRHERYNVEEWRCHLCTFVSARKDKLLKHLRESHNLRGSTRKSHCQQLLEPVARPCGFCLKQFDDWTLWLNHVCAHFEGQIAGGPWTMARWHETLIQGLGSDEGDDDDDNDDDDDDEDHNGNDEDPTDPDCDSSAADEAGGRPSKGKGASYGHGSRGSSRSSGISKAASPGNVASKPYQRGGNESLHYEQDTCTAQCANSSGMPAETRRGTSRMSSRAVSAPCTTASVSEKDRGQTRGALASDFITLQNPSNAAADIMGVNGHTPFRETTSNPRRVRMCRLQPQPPTDPFKFRILPAGYDTRIVGNNASDVNIAADKSVDGLQKENPRAEANFPKTRLGKLDLSDDPNPPIYHDDVPVLSTQGLIDTINPPCPNSPTHLDGPPSPTTTVGPKASIRKRSVVDGGQRAAQSVREDRSCLPCWRKEWTCAQKNEDQTTKSWQGTRNLSRNDNHQDVPDQIIRSTLSATAIKSPKDYPYTIPDTKCYELNAPSKAPHEAAFACESGLRLDLINTVIAVMGMTGVGKSAFVRMPSKQIILDHSRIDFDAVRKHSLPDRSNGYTHSPTPSSPISLLLSCLIYSSGFGATYHSDAEILCEFNLLLARYERSFRPRVEDGSKHWIAQHPLVHVPARSNAFLPAVGRAKCSGTALQPGRASFDTIRRLHGVKDRAHLTRFKLDRYLNDHSSGCYPETLFEGSSQCDAFEESKEIFDERYKEGLLLEIRPAIDGDSSRVAHFASAPGIPGASRRGRKKRCEELPQQWPI